MNENDEPLGFHRQMRMLVWMLVPLLLLSAIGTLRDSAGQTPH
jgi:hypothetical protein